MFGEFFIFKWDLHEKKRYQNKFTYIYLTDNLPKSDMEIPWSTEKFDALDGPTDNNESTQKILSSQFDER